MRNNRIIQILVSRKFFYITIVVIIGIYIIRDSSRLNRDYINLTLFLDNVRLVSARDHKTMMVTFAEKSVRVREGAGMPIIAVFNAPSLDEMQYASDLGNDVILYHDGLIDERRHRMSEGFIRLKSIVGFKKIIRINSDGINDGD